MADENEQALPAEQETAEPQEKKLPEEQGEPEDLASKYDLGVYAQWWHSPEEALLKEDLEADVFAALTTLNSLASRSDIAARRFEVEQAWEAKLFQRGYQHLTARKGGGFELPGEDTRWGPTAQINRSNLLNTNIFSKTHDILVGAICREVPRVQFLPSNPDYNPEVTAAQTADKYKLVYQRNNNLKALMREIASKFCTDDRVVTLTGYFLDGPDLGYEEDAEPVSPETEASGSGANMADAMKQLLDKVGGSKRKPKGMERTLLFDKLSSKVPITAKCMAEMPWIQLFQDLDEAYVKAMFPFAKDRVRAEGPDSSEIELDRIARMNTNLAIQGKYVTGDSLQRLCTVRWTFLRPSFFYAGEVKPSVGEKLCKLFPDGVLIATAGNEIMFARNCAMNDHVSVAHAFPGDGQNRRALLTSIMSIQKRLNDWMDLMGDFFVRTVPKRYYDQTAFDIELIQSLDNVPGGAVPFVARAGTALSELMGSDPIVQNQPAMADFIKWFEGELNDDISGALASLYGGAVDQNTVGGAEIQRDQALGRLNAPWNAIQELFAEMHRQAVKCAALCRQKDVDDMIPSSGRVTFEIGKMRGNVLCYPEYDTSFPESSSQKLARFEKLWDSAKDNPVSAKLIMGTKNLKALKDNLRFKEIEVAGAAEYEKQQGEFQILVKTGPIPNPEIQDLLDQIAQHTAEVGDHKALLQKSVQGMAQDMAQGTHDPNEVQQAAPMLTGIEQEMQQKQHQIDLMQEKVQGLQQKQPETSTVPIAQDKSENHAVEAEACYDWMNSPEGRRYKHGTPEEQDVFKNFYLHWKEHSDMDAQLNPPSNELKSTGESISVPVDKMPPNVAIQALAKVGITATADDFAAKADDDTKQTIKQRTAPKVISKLTRS